MDKKNSKKLSKVFGKSKKRKDQIILKRRIKKILQCDNLEEMADETDTVMETDDFTEQDLDLTLVPAEVYDNNLNKNKTKKVLLENLEESNKKTSKVKVKGTLQEENEMLTVISDIISSKSTIQNVIKSTKSGKKQTHNTDLQHNEDIVFDPNKSLAKKIIKKIKSKDHLNSNVCIISPVVLKQKKAKQLKKNLLTEMDGYIKPKKKIIQKPSYKYSVLEIFDNCKHEYGAAISFGDFAGFDASLKEKNSDTIAENIFAYLGDPNNLNSAQESFDVNMDNDAIINQSPPIIESEKQVLPENPKTYSLFALSDFCIVKMKPYTKLYFCGKLKASLIHGSVEVLGYKLTHVPQDIYSLPSYSLLCFESLIGIKKAAEISQLTCLGVPLGKAREILEGKCDDDSILLLQPHDNIMTEFVSTRFSSQFYNSDVFSRARFDENSINSEVFKLLHCHFSTELRKGLFVNNFYWENISELILKEKKHILSKSSVTILCGGKNAGKSTMLRYLVNRTLSDGPVFVIDLDPGQPEFTVSGLVSATLVEEPLLGPGFTHLKQPNRSLCVGLINVAENEKRYIKCVQDLYKYCHNYEKYATFPWIINTMGFTGLLGLKLLTAIINIFKPTILIELQSNVSRNNFDIQLTTENINEYQKSCDFEMEITLQNHEYNYYPLEPFQQGWNSSKSSMHRPLEPKVERLFNAMAYFSQIPMGKSLSIMEMVPYTISLNDVGLAFNNIYIDYSHTPSVLNGRMVALCLDNRFCTQEHKKGNIFEIELAYCYGYGIVRGIDMVNSKLYIITPVKSHDMSHVNSLVYWENTVNCKDMFVCGLPQGTMVPYTTPKLNTTEHTYLMKTPKRHFNPFRLLKMKQNS